MKQSSCAVRAAILCQTTTKVSGKVMGGDQVASAPHLLQSESQRWLCAGCMCCEAALRMCLDRCVCEVAVHGGEAEEEQSKKGRQQKGGGQQRMQQQGYCECCTSSRSE